MVHALLVLAAEKSEAPFFILGLLFAAWAVVIGVLGMRSESFGSERGISTVIIGVSVVLAAATMTAMILVSG